MPQSHVKVYTLKATATDGREVFVTQITIDCPTCETLTYTIPGHHLRTIRDCLIDVIDQYPEEAGPEAGPKLKTAERSTFAVGGGLSQKPESN